MNQTEIIYLKFSCGLWSIILKATILNHSQVPINGCDRLGTPNLMENDNYSPSNKGGQDWNEI